MKEITYTTTKDGTATLVVDKETFRVIFQEKEVFAIRDAELWDIIKRHFLDSANVLSRRHIEAKAAELITTAFSYGG